VDLTLRRMFGLDASVRSPSARTVRNDQRRPFRSPGLRSRPWAVLLLVQPHGGGTVGKRMHHIQIITSITPPPHRGDSAERVRPLLW